jgi:hypothetical protein
MVNKRLERRAYHEAGHAVACHIVRLPYGYVTIHPDEDSLGHMKTRLRKVRFNTNRRLRNKERNDLESNIMALLGGFAAEKLLRGNVNPGVSPDEWRMAYHITIYLNYKRFTREVYLNWLFERIKEWLEIPCYWKSVRKVAHQLMVNRKLDRQTVRRLIESTLKKSNSEMSRWKKTRRQEDMKEFRKGLDSLPSGRRSS